MKANYFATLIFVLGFLAGVAASISLQTINNASWVVPQ
jgi:hypothetical protein